MRRVRGLYKDLAAVTMAAVGLVSSLTVASAFDLRASQVPVLGGTLQGYLNGVGQSINVSTDQLDARVVNAPILYPSSALVIELTKSTEANSLGVYNADGPPVPPLFQIFPAAASAGW